MGSMGKRRRRRTKSSPPWAPLDDGADPLLSRPLTPAGQRSAVWAIVRQILSGGPVTLGGRLLAQLLLAGAVVAVFAVVRALVG